MTKCYPCDPVTATVAAVCDEVVRGALTSPKRGLCRVCRTEYQLRGDGKIRGHMCTGGSLPPVSSLEWSAHWINSPTVRTYFTDFESSVAAVVQAEECWVIRSPLSSGDQEAALAYAGRIWFPTDSSNFWSVPPVSGGE